MSALDLSQHPFYAARLDARGRPTPWTLEDLEGFAAARRDPYGGRLRRGAPPPPLSIQLEACDEPPLWVGLEGRELEAWAGGLASLWARYGVARGECVALFEYGSSPLVLLASAAYAPHLRRGAAERLGARVLCNDGVASLADRMVEVVERVRPAALVLRRDVLAPLAEAFRTAGASLRDACRWVALCEAEGAPSRADAARARERLEVPVFRVLRADAAFVLAGECSRCAAFHLDRRLYRVADLGAESVSVTARFARRCPAVEHRLEGFSLRRETCPLEPRAWRLAWA